MNETLDGSGKDLILGVDGGGTGTTAWLARMEDPTLTVGRGEAGPSNVRAIGMELATRNMIAAIRSAFEDAGQRAETVERACLALAGVDRPEDRLQIENWATGQQIARDLIVTNDGLSVLHAVDPRGVGIALIAGTGSFCLGRDESGRVVRSGGWGYLLGDEGSAYWISIEALRGVARAADSRGPATSLTQRAAKHFEFDQAHDLISRIYAPQMRRDQLASFAASVFESASDGDAVAIQIVEMATVALAAMVRSVWSQININQQQIALACTGGVLLHQGGLVKRLAAQLNALNADGSESTLFNLAVVPDPVAGAIRIAATGATPNETGG